MEHNLSRYTDPSVVAHYAKQEDILACEAVLFDKYIVAGGYVLDLGMGGGRTTAALVRMAGKYLGMDYSAAMVAAASARFPDQKFLHGDATDLTRFRDNSFDNVVFSFNGIDYIRDDKGRAKCLAEIARVLKPGGTLVFSSHNAQALGLWPHLHSARGLQIPWRIVRSIGKATVYSLRVLRAGVFRAGEGYVVDPIHAGLHTYVSTPEPIERQCAAAGMKLVETVGGDYPHVRSRYLQPWFYYACRKLGNAS